jgi:hypothetical protein
LELSRKARYQITWARSGPEAFASVSWSFLRMPDTNSHRHSPALRPCLNSLELSHKAN